MTSSSLVESEAVDQLERIREEVRAFASERDWLQFHTPKNLAMALAAEAGELLEQFQWLTAEQSAHLDEPRAAAVRAEMADVLLYLVMLADRLGVDLAQAARDKIARNALKYPADQVRGKATRPGEE